jgi:hypothetical protein
VTQSGSQTISIATGSFQIITFLKAISTPGRSSLTSTTAHVATHSYPQLLIIRKTEATFENNATGDSLELIEDSRTLKHQSSTSPASSDKLIESSEKQTKLPGTFHTQLSNGGTKIARTKATRLKEVKLEIPEAKIEIQYLPVAKA